jgi:hypothetical protein
VVVVEVGSSGGAMVISRDSMYEVDEDEVVEVEVLLLLRVEE